MPGEPTSRSREAVSCRVALQAAASNGKCKTLDSCSPRLETLEKTRCAKRLVVLSSHVLMRAPRAFLRLPKPCIHTQPSSYNREPR